MALHLINHYKSHTKTSTTKALPCGWVWACVWRRNFLILLPMIFFCVTLPPESPLIGGKGDRKVEERCVMRFKRHVKEKKTQHWSMKVSTFLPFCSDFRLRVEQKLGVKPNGTIRMLMFLNLRRKNHLPADVMSYHVDLVGFLKEPARFWITFVYVHPRSLSQKRPERCFMNFFEDS